MLLGKIGPLEILIVLVVLLMQAVFVVPFWKIFSRAGHPGYYSLGMLVPFINLALLFYLAYGEWPALKDR